MIRILATATKARPSGSDVKDVSKKLEETKELSWTPFISLSISSSSSYSGSRQGTRGQRERGTKRGICTQQRSYAKRQRVIWYQQQKNFWYQSIFWGQSALWKKNPSTFYAKAALSWRREKRKCTFNLMCFAIRGQKRKKGAVALVSYLNGD